MTAAERAILIEIASRVSALAEGRPATAVAADGDVGAEVRAVAEAVNGLMANLSVLCELSVALANGRIDFDVPPRMHLLDSLKSLQASLRHLTWQTQEVAAGNLNHRVEFLGEFSTAFNRMVEALREKERVEREVMQSARLASIGQLAAGIAHEINTPVQYIGDNLRYIEAALPKLDQGMSSARELAAGAAAIPELASAASRFEDTLERTRLARVMSELPAAVGESLEGVAQIGRIVLSMKEFSHPGTTAKTSSDINHAVESTLTVSRNSWKHLAVIERNLDPDLPPVICHAGEIGQVFLNLILNAAYAIEASGKPLPGRIVVSTGRDGRIVEIRIGDSGNGVPVANRERIFEPFFTTKPVGSGTGQGLAICRDVVSVKHGGSIEVGGDEGEGAVFIVRLPIDGSGGVGAAKGEG